jgi:dihydroorotate dehydrogenase electron transfer subunit
MIQTRVKIIYNKRIKGNYWKCIFNAPKIVKGALPGQFVNIKVADSLEPLLRRPFSIERTSGSKIEILYEVLGKGTQVLSRRQSGEFLNVIGPLGNGFDYRPSTVAHRRPILIAGGMGVAPLAFLAEKLTKLETLVLIGAKTNSQILCEKEFKDLGCNVKIATDDGSRGFKGKVTELLKRVLRTADNKQQITIYACGPRPMLKEISCLSKQYSIPAQVSLEEHMACGIGACFGCAVNTIDGYKRACKDGPVFKAEEITW